MTQRTRERWTLGLAILGSIAGVISLMFNFFQWVDGDRKLRINGAIEVSKIYLQDPEISRRYELILNYTPNPAQITEDNLRGRSFVDFLSYISLLVIENKIDNDFLSWRIKCDIYYVVTFIAPKRPDLGNVFKDMNRFIQAGKDQGCPERAKPQP
jgi:hypothetical protein